MNPDRLKEQAEDAQVEAALRNFRASIHYWSEQEIARPRVIERTGWSRFQTGLWRMIANPTLGGALAAALLITSVGVPVGIHHERVMEAARQAEPGLDAGFANGDLAPLTAWLARNVHGLGARLGFHEVLAQATGNVLSAAAFEAHLTSRYLPN